mmetsp:Transcript_19240/g.47575  ORF Transcript_19240/g.47575 Transcript_19240/m.47575 type:complete len:268 (+) Transcript_19240:3470-4273(+)
MYQNVQKPALLGHFWSWNLQQKVSPSCDIWFSPMVGGRGISLERTEASESQVRPTKVETLLHRHVGGHNARHHERMDTPRQHHGPSFEMLPELGFGKPTCRPSFPSRTSRKKSMDGRTCERDGADHDSTCGLAGCLQAILLVCGLGKDWFLLLVTPFGATANTERAKTARTDSRIRARGASQYRVGWLGARWNWCSLEKEMASSAFLSYGLFLLPSSRCHQYFHHLPNPNCRNGPRCKADQLVVGQKNMQEERQLSFSFLVSKPKWW